MAFLQVNLMSESLMRTVMVNVILPVDKIPAPGEAPRGDKPFKTLYLLHGLIGSHVDWVNGTRIQRFAEENDLAVVMPAGYNAFYLDFPESHDYYGEFVGKELVELTRKMFPLSKKREDTFIGGLSMGGYGALRNGLKYNQTFGRIVALSSALYMEEMADKTDEEELWFERKTYLESRYGDLKELLKTDKNPKWLVKQLVDKKALIPEIYMACGDEDRLLDCNTKFANFLKENSVHVDYEIGKGNHEWDFWDTYIKKAIYEWLPTEKSGMGLSSGNIGDR